MKISKAQSKIYCQSTEDSTSFDVRNLEISYCLLYWTESLRNKYLCEIFLILFTCVLSSSIFHPTVKYRCKIRRFYILDRYILLSVICTFNIIFCKDIDLLPAARTSLNFFSTSLIALFCIVCNFRVIK